MVAVNTLFQGISEVDLVGASATEQTDLDPNAYARNYSISCYPEDSMYHDEQLILDFLIERQALVGKQRDLLDIGAASIIPYALAISKNVATVHFADIFPEHLELVNEWVQARPIARSWHTHTKYVVEREAELNKYILSNVDRAVLDRENEFRLKLNAVLEGDLCSKRPLKFPRSYSIVNCFYAAEQAAAHLAKQIPAQPETAMEVAWLQVMENLCSLVAPGGHLFFSAICESEFYAIKDHNNVPQKIRIMDVGPKDIKKAVSLFGLEAQAIEVVSPKGLEDEGMKKILILHATKSAQES